MHGIKTNFLTQGTRPIVSASTGVLGLVGTAPDAPAGTFPLNARVLITDVRKALATIGATGTLPAALAAIADVANPVIVLVRVGVDAQGQDALTMAGIDLLLAAEMETGQRPRILGAPGLDTEAVTTHFAGVARKLRGFLYFAGQGATVAEAITYRANFGEREMMMIWPNWSSDFAGDAVARAMGLRAQIDADTGWHKTISNVPVTGVTGIARDITFDFGSETTDAALLNAAGITTLVRFGGGYRYWGNRTCSDEPLWAFESVVRSSQVIGDEIEQGLAWAADKPMTVMLVKDTVDTVNARLRQYVTQGRLIGGRAWYDPALNSAAQLAGGQAVIDYDFTGVAPMEGLTLNARVTDQYYADFASQLAA
ncbi:phage tail sheath subtilisin-like domain-containing protein [Novosphingobium sp.]|uniref:phage tail sheath subtilisin-like domain-containing protein n=1 Tax=Novosphingobium sp. TaxID=1874826 RepID=UPI002FDCFD4A